MPPDFHGSCILSSFIHEMGTARAATKSEEGGQRERGAEVNFMNFIFFLLTLIVNFMQTRTI